MSGERALEVHLAGPGDAADLAAIYASDGGFGGDVRVSFRRMPDPLASLAAEGDRVVVPLVREATTGSPVGMGACVVRRTLVAGEPRTVGYLTGMKVVPGFRRAPLAIPRVYDLLRASTPEVEVYVSTIVDANGQAARMLERGHRGMPRYRYRGHLTTHAFRGAAPTSPGWRLGGGTLAELLALRAADGLGDLALLEPPAGITDDQVCLLRDRHDRPVAGCAMWDQRAHKQHLVTGYGGVHALLSRLPTGFTGLPRYPTPGQVADEVCLSLVWSSRREPGALRALLRAVGWAERRRDHVLVAGPDDGPVHRAMRGRPAVRYGSRLYTVHFADQPELCLADRLDVEVGLL